MFIRICTHAFDLSKHSLQVMDFLISLVAITFNNDGASLDSKLESARTFIHFQKV